jgi:DNA mismatch repair protein MSH3
VERQSENNTKEEDNNKRTKQNESLLEQKDKTHYKDSQLQPGHKLFPCLDCDSGLQTPARPIVKYTPLEKQYLDIKAQYPDAMLLVECGYKYRLFGNDAVIAAKLLNLFCHMEHNFETASFPVHRLGVHLNRLVASGYKVGVVKQTETAALKAVGSNKSNLFDRKLVGLYTKSTLIGVDIGLSPTQTDEIGPVGGFLLCVVDDLMVTDKRSSDGVGGKDNVEIGIVAVNPTSGEIVYDCFHDTCSCSHLELCLLHINPVELLIPHTITTQTSKFIKQTYGKTVRIQYCDYEVLNPEMASARINRFYEHEGEVPRAQFA